MKFWKVNLRKFYAVPEDDLQRSRRKRGRGDDQDTALTDLEDAVHGMRNEMIAINDKLDKLCSVTKDMKIPIGLKVLLHDAFKCKICLSTPVKPSIIYARCCKSILGYQVPWTNGMQMGKW